MPGEETALTGNPSPFVSVPNPTEAPLESMPSPEASAQLQSFRVPEAIIANSPPSARGLSSSLPGHSPVTASYGLDSPEILQLKRRFSLERMQEDPVLALHFKEVDLTAKEHQVEEVLGSPHQPAEEKPACKRRLKTMRRLITLQDKEGNKYVNQYLLLKSLGQGSHGKVKLSLNTHDSCLYAMKIIDKALLRKKRFGSRAAMNDAMREIAIMKRLAHPNIVALHEVIDDPMDDKLYMIIEYVEGGPVWGRDDFEPLPEDLARKYFREVCQGLDYLHHHKIVHRDIKPENLLLAPDGTVKIGDFGVSDMFEESDAMHRPAGTPAFLAPEACSSDTFRGRDLDVWALGVCLYLMVVGRLPFEADSVGGMYHRIVHEPLAFPPGVELSPELVDLLIGILQKDPLRRLQLIQVMGHPWVTRGGAAPLRPLQAASLHTVSQHRRATTGGDH